MSVPTPKEVLAAMLDHGADVNTYKGWDRTGGAVPTRGVLMHHTATASASVSNPAPTLGWCVSAYNKPVANMLIGKTPGHTYLLAALTGNGTAGAYHCGTGGPVKWAGIPQGNRPDLLWGIEIDDPGVKNTLTDYQVDNAAKVVAGLWDVFGWSDDRSIMTHKCWTDGCHGANPDGPSPNLGRKNDTHDGSWGSWPGDSKPAPYNAPFWREKVQDILDGERNLWDGTVPSREAVMNVHPDSTKNPGGENKATWRLRARLSDLGYIDPAKVPAEKRSKYPTSGMQRFRTAQGWDGDGYSKTAQKRLFGVDKP